MACQRPLAATGSAPRGSKPGLRRWNQRDLFRVVLTNLTTAIVGSALDQIAITFMLTGTKNTLPMAHGTSLRGGIWSALSSGRSLH